MAPGPPRRTRGRAISSPSTARPCALEVVDPAKGTIVAGAPLAGSPDYVRYVAATNEVWVTEPDKDGIEIFTLSDAKPPVPAHKAFLAIPGGPESLVIDNAAKVALRQPLEETPRW